MPRRLRLSPHLHYLRDVQDHVLSVAQAYECGFTRRSIQRGVVAGRWQRLLPGVLLLHDQPPTRRQLVHAAALWVGPDAAIDAESACVWHGIALPQLDERLVHVVAPYESGARSRDFVVVRRSGVIVRGGRGAVASYVDAATAAVVAGRRLSTDRAVVALLSRPLQTGKVTLDDLVAAHMHAPPRGSRRVGRALDELSAGVRSGGESVARALFARSTVLPPVLWNRWLRLPDGGPLVCADGLLVDAGMVVEVNSKRYHAWALAFEDTEARQLRLTAAGLVVAPITPRRVMVDGAGVLRDVEQTYLLHAGRGLPAGVELVEDPIRRLAA
jgi:hypothetical protein